MRPIDLPSAAPDAFPTFEPSSSAPRPLKRPVGSTRADEAERQAALANDAKGRLLGKAIESPLRATLRAIPKGSSEAELFALAGIEVKLGGKLKVRLEKGERDEVKVGLGAGATAALGVSLSIFKGLAAATGEGELVMRFGSPEEAADKLSAIAQVIASPAVWMAGPSVIDPDAAARAASSWRNVESLKGTLSLSEILKANLSATASIDGSLGTTASVELQPKTGKLILEQGLVASERAGEVPVGPWKVRTDLLGAGALRVSIRREVKLSPTEVAGVLSGRVPLGDCLTRLKRADRPELVAYASGRLAGAQVEATRTVPLTRQVPTLKDFEDLLNPRAADWRWTSGNASVELSYSLDVGAVEGKVRIQTVADVFGGVGSLPEAKAAIELSGQRRRQAAAGAAAQRLTQ